MSNPTKSERLALLITQLTALGFTFAEVQRLRRIESTLRRWATAECNGEIQRDGENGDGKPFRVYEPAFTRDARFPNVPRMSKRYPIPDREAGARKQLAAIMAAHPTLWAYNQTDPRGCALYVGKLADLKTDSNQIVRKAESWGATFIQKGRHWYVGNTNSTACASEEAAALLFLEIKRASVPARDLLPLDQYYTRGVAVCV